MGGVPGSLESHHRHHHPFHTRTGVVLAATKDKLFFPRSTYPQPPTRREALGTNSATKETYLDIFRKSERDAFPWRFSQPCHPFFARSTHPLLRCKKKNWVKLALSTSVCTLAIQVRRMACEFEIYYSVLSGLIRPWSKAAESDNMPEG